MLQMCRGGEGIWSKPGRWSLLLGALVSWAGGTFVGLPSFASAPVLGEAEGSAETGTHPSLSGLSVVYRPHLGLPADSPGPAHPLLSSVPSPRPGLWRFWASFVVFTSQCPALCAMLEGRGHDGQVLIRRCPQGPGSGNARRADR